MTSTPLLYLNTLDHLSHDDASGIQLYTLNSARSINCLFVMVPAIDRHRCLL